MRRWPWLGPTVALAGGVLMVVGPFLLWASVRPDAAAFARTLHEGVRPIREAIRETTADFTWLEGGTHGDLGLVLGFVAGVAAAVAVRRPRRLLGTITITAGLVVALLALRGAPDADALRRQAVRTSAPWATAVHADPLALAKVFAIRQGPSTAVCALGGLLAAVGGALLVVGAWPGAEALVWTPWATYRPEDR